MTDWWNADPVVSKAGKTPAAKDQWWMSDPPKTGEGMRTPAQYGAKGPEVSTSSIRGMDPEADYETGSGIITRYNLQRASNPREEEAYLKSSYGEGGFRKDEGGNWLVKQNGKWTAVYPYGVGEGLKSFGAAAAAAVPTTGGAAAGAGLGGMVGGVPGAIAGAGLGTAAGKGIDELAKAFQGFYRKTPAELGASVGGETALAMGGQAAGPLGAAVKKPLLDFTSKGLKSISGMTPETQAIKHSLDPMGVKGPISSLAPNLKTFEYDRMLRNLLSGDPKEKGRIAAIDERSKQVLAGFGMNQKQIDEGMKVIKDRMTELSGKETADVVKGRLESGAKARAYQIGTQEARYETSAANFERQASDIVQRTYDNLRALTRPQSDVAGRALADIEGARVNFYREVGGLYRQADQMTGAVPVVDLSDVSAIAGKLVDSIDPSVVPPIIKRLVGAPGIPIEKMTFEQAHELRTSLRQMAAIKDFSPIGQRRGIISNMAGAVDNALQAAEGQAGANAAAALRAADDAFSKGVVRFTNHEVNSALQDARQGRAPDPGVVVNMLLDKKSADSVKQVWGMLSPETQEMVRTADRQNMLDSISVFKNGKNTVNPESLMKWLDDRSSVNQTVYSSRELDDLRSWATDARRVNKTVEIPSAGGGNVASLLRQAQQQRVQAETMAKDNPLAALRSKIPDVSDEGARWFIRPGNETATLEGVRALGGENSPEWQKVRQFAIQDLLKNAVKSRGKGLGETVSGPAMEDIMREYTSAQQRAIFGNRLDDVRLIAQQAKYLFPEFQSQFGGSLAAASIQGHLPSLKAIRAYTWSQIAGKIADSEMLQNLVAGQLRADPYQGRALLGWMLQGGVDIGAMPAMRSMGIMDYGSTPSIPKMGGLSFLSPIGQAGAAEFLPPKGSPQAVRPGKLPGEAGGGGEGRIDFQSAGAKRVEGAERVKQAPTIETPEVAAVRKSEMKAAFDKLMEKSSAREPARSGREVARSSERVGFKSLGTAKEEALPKLRQAFESVRKDQGNVGDASISELISRSGLSKEEVHRTLLEAAQRGEVTLSQGNQMAATESRAIRDAAINFPGDPPLKYVFFKPAVSGPSPGQMREQIRQQLRAGKRLYEE